MPKLNQKETLELARMQLKTAYHRLQELVEFLAAVPDIKRNEKLSRLFLGAWTEITKAGENLFKKDGE